MADLTDVNVIMSVVDLSGNKPTKIDPTLTYIIPGDATSGMADIPVSGEQIVRVRLKHLSASMRYQDKLAQKRDDDDRALQAYQKAQNAQKVAGKAAK